jgi:Spy/CpxP family protein refolding chaperone
MKALLITLGLLIASSTALAGQPEGRTGEDRAAHMQEKLGLSDDQMTQMREIREQGGGREEMRAILTDEQQAQMKEMKGHDKGGREERMQSHLNLSDDQMTQIRQIREQGGNREDMQAVLTEEQRAKLAERRDRHKAKQQPEV